MGLFPPGSLIMYCLFSERFSLLLLSLRWEVGRDFDLERVKELNKLLVDLYHALFDVW